MKILTIKKKGGTFAKSDLFASWIDRDTNHKAEDMEGKDCDSGVTVSQLSDEEVHMNHPRGENPSSGSLR